MKGTLFMWFLGISLLSSRAEGDCISELGIKTIPDENITASSSLNNRSTPAFARLDGVGAWCSAKKDQSPFIQIVLDEEKSITAITIQGSHRELRWVTQFQIKYLKGGKWLTFDKADGSQNLQGNIASRRLKKNILQPPVITRTIRIYPKAWNGVDQDSSLNNVSCLRLELYGCSAPGYALADNCVVSPTDRTDCGWPGIGRTNCLKRGCCHDSTHPNTAWCFFPTNHKCYGINSQYRADCGYPGISRTECENKGCCFDDDVSNVPWCFKGDKCVVKPADRTDCGWPGIGQANCLTRGCCHDSTYPDTAWCFFPTDHKCHGINPQKRTDCGHPGISRQECENKNCCFDDDVSNVPWCFVGR